jgi:thymidylate synthase (FAD)
MIEVTNPQVFLIAEPMIRTQDMLDYLHEVGGEDWFHRVFDLSKGDRGGLPAGEALTEFMGRLCYKSWIPGLNANVTKIREDRGEYLLNILRTGHGSVLEHAHFSFALHDVSRVLTAELNRHRPGIAISEQSLRYVRLDELRFRLPPVLREDTQVHMKGLIQTIEDAMKFMMNLEGLDDPNLDFAQKKIITSALRRAAPLGLATEEGWTANIRSIRHVIEMRSDKAAEEEIRVFAWQLYSLMAAACPLLFGDYTDVDGDLQTDHRKV